MNNCGFKFYLLKVSTEMKKKNKLEQSLASCLCLCLSTSLKPKFQPNSSENYFNLINILREVPQTGGGQQNSFLFHSPENSLMNDCSPQNILNIPDCVKVSGLKISPLDHIV